MTIPFRVVEEYIFHVDGISGVVRGRVLEQIISTERMERIKKDNLTYEQFSWETSHSCGSYQNTHPVTAEDAAQGLFRYMDRFDAAESKLNEDY